MAGRGAILPRSTAPRDNQNLSQPVALMSKSFPAGFHISSHAHARDQLLYAVAGTMQVRTGQPCLDRVRIPAIADSDSGASRTAVR